MPNALQQAGATAEPSNFAPLHTNRMVTGLWSNRSFLRDAATTEFQEKYGMGRQDSILDGLNTEISPRLTVMRRPGHILFNPDLITPIKRFYSFNTFTLTDELIRVLADTSAAVLDVTESPSTTVWTKGAAAIGKPTYFLSVGNILYFTNGVENKQWNYETDVISDWGIDAPVNAPLVMQQPRPNPYGRWNPNTVYAAWVNTSSIGAPVANYWNMVVIRGSDIKLHSWGTTNGAVVMNGQLGSHEPAWSGSGPDLDGTIEWTNRGSGAWIAGNGYGLGELAVGIIPAPSGTDEFLFLSVRAGPSDPTNAPQWAGAPQVGMQVADGSGGLIWQNIGRLLKWADVATDAGLPSGKSNFITTGSQIVDPNGYLQTVYQMGTSSPTVTITFQTELYALTTDAAVLWQNGGPFATAGTAPLQYGYAYMNSATDDISNMSPASAPIVIFQNNEVVIQGDGSADPQVDVIPIFRTAQGGSTFLYLDQVPNPGAGQKWTYIDHNIPDSQLNTEWQAQVDGEGTPLPAGATCLGYHLERIFAAVGNVVWISAGPDAIVGGSSGNAGFDTTFTCQSKIIRFWACSLGMVVFTVRDAYIILGSATDADPLYMVVFIEDLPLRSYDCFTVNKTTPYLFLGDNTLVALDPSAGITEVGYPIADRLLNQFDPAASYLTFHKQSGLDTALYISNGVDRWYRMAAVTAPESGSAWSPAAVLPGGLGLGCVQSVEVAPGQYRLLIHATTPGPILQRDRSTWSDNGVPYSAFTRFGAIVLALPGQLAALHFITLESAKVGNRPSLSLLLGEASGTFEALKRTHQDPTNLPPSKTIYSDRYHFGQSQQAAWCRYFQMEIEWAAEAVPNELFTFTIFGQTWQEMRAQ